MKVLATALVYTVSLAIVAALTFFAVLFLAGPHAGLFPVWLEQIIIGMGWLSIIVVPVMITIRIRRSIGWFAPGNKETETDTYQSRTP